MAIHVQFCEWPPDRIAFASAFTYSVIGAYPHSICWKTNSLSPRIALRKLWISAFRNSFRVERSRCRSSILAIQFFFFSRHLLAAIRFFSIVCSRFLRALSASITIFGRPLLDEDDFLDRSELVRSLPPGDAA